MGHHRAPRPPPRGSTGSPPTADARRADRGRWRPACWPTCPSRSRRCSRALDERAARRRRRAAPDGGAAGAGAGAALRRRPRHRRRRRWRGSATALVLRICTGLPAGGDQPRRRRRGRAARGTSTRCTPPSRWPLRSTRRPQRGAVADHAGRAGRPRRRARPAGRPDGAAAARRRPARPTPRTGCDRALSVGVPAPQKAGWVDGFFADGALLLIHDQRPAGAAGRPGCAGWPRRSSSTCCRWCDVRSARSAAPSAARSRPGSGPAAATSGEPAARRPRRGPRAGRRGHRRARCWESGRRWARERRSSRSPCAAGGCCSAASAEEELGVRLGADDARDGRRPSRRSTTRDERPRPGRAAAGRVARPGWAPPRRGWRAGSATSAPTSRPASCR